ncbi:MAG: SRPBCC family protein [Acidimicrobiales bacterium]
MTVRGEGTAFVRGVTAQDVFDFVLDPAQYRKADTKIVWVTKLADTPGGMIAREDGKFLGRFRGSVVTRYRWEPPHRIDVTLEHGVPERLHAWFEIHDADGGARLHHVEEMHFGHALAGRLYDVVARRWFARAVEQEVREIARLLEAGERGGGLASL